MLLTCQHQNLASYLDILRGKHQRIIIVVEKWTRNLQKMFLSNTTEQNLINIAKQILLGTAYLNQMNIVNTNLTRENIMLTDTGDVKLFHYGFGRITNYGAWVDFPIGDPRLTAPEILRQNKNVDTSHTSMTDSQSGMVE